MKLGFQIGSWKNSLVDISSDIENELDKINNELSLVKCDCPQEKMIECKNKCILKSTSLFAKSVEEIKDSVDSLIYNMNIFIQRTRNEG